MISYIPDIMQSLLAPLNIFCMVVGVLVGIIIGALPGLTVTMALALLLPFTFSMAGDTALITLGGLYIGGMYGGCISAILINTPGTPSAIATTFDGYPLAKKGKAIDALISAAVSSGIGGIIGGFALLFLTPVLAKLALQFGPPEYFWIAMLGLTIIASLSSNTLLKGLIGGAVGLLLSTIGISPIGGESRYTFGFPPLQAGLELIVILIAFFCIPEVFEMVERKIKKRQEEQTPTLEKGIVKRVLKQVMIRPFLLMRSAIIGIVIGIIPGAGGNVAGLLSYDAAVRFSKRKERKTFGKGNMDGVIAAESSNNAEVGGSLVPLLSLGIPGAPPAAIILGALMIQGIQPGPNLLTEHGALVYTFLISFILANVVMLVAGIYGSAFVGKLITMPVYYLAPLIVLLTVIGSYAIRNNFLDVIFMLGFGLLAYVAKKIDFHPAPIVLGLILGPIAERGLAQSMLMGKAQGSVLEVFFTRPISVILICLCFLSLVGPLLAKLKSNKTEKGELG